MLEDSPSNVHRVGAFSDKDCILGDVFLDDGVGRIISHWDYLFCHQFFIQLLVL